MNPCHLCGKTHEAAESCAYVLSFAGGSLAAAGDAELREFEGLAIPYGEELERLDWVTGATRWIFEKGSVKIDAGAKLYFGHAHLGDPGATPIGKIVLSKQTDGGVRIRAKISKTPKGDEVYTLLQDGVLDRLSVGLDRVNAKTRVEDADSDAPLLVWEDVPGWETSVVPMPAYASAAIDAVLQHQPKGNKMDPCTKCGKTHAAGVEACETTGPTLADLGSQFEGLSSSITQLERQVATLGTPGTPDAAPFALQSESYGEWLQQLAAGEQNALDFLAFVGTETGDLGAAWTEGTWVGDLTRRLQERRRVLNLFRTRPLPAKGMTVEFGRVLDESGVNVGEQLAEGDLLPYGKLAFDAGASAPVRTFGGWGDMSRQVIERSGVAVVELFFEALFTRYLQVTEAAARVLAVDPLNATPAQTIAASDLTDADGWIDFMADAAFALDDAGLPLDFVLVSRDRWKTLAKMRDGDTGDAPRLLDRRNGSVNIVGLNGELFTVPVIPLNVAGDYVRAGSSEAITTFEAPGAPFRLQDDDITNLTKAFSLYGYAAFASTNAKALIRPTVAGDL